MRRIINTLRADFRSVSEPGRFRPGARRGGQECPPHDEPAPRRSIVAGALFVAAVALGAGPALGQPANLDEGEFIQGLRERGMRELLLYHLEKNPPEDPIVQRELAIEQHKFRAQDLLDKGQPGQASEQIGKVLEQYRKLFEQAPADHEKLPIWRTDFARYIVDTALPLAHNNAAAFAEFGVMKKAQRQAFDKLVAEAIEHMDRAADELFRLIGRLPKRNNFQQKFVNNGFWFTLRQEYGNILLPTYRARAHLLGRFRQEPRGNLGGARQWIGDVLEQNLADSARPPLHSALGRVLLAMDNPAEAIEWLDKAVEAGDGRTAFLARLAKSKALEADGKTDAAKQQIEKARGSEFAGRSPLMLLLAYDRLFKLTGSYDVYPKLFEDPALADRFREPVRSHVMERLAENPLSAEKLKQAAPLVVLANANGMINRQEMQRALETLKMLLEREGVNGRIRAQALFKLGVVHYRQDNQFDAARRWAQLASEMPGQPVARNAALNGFALSRGIYRNNKDNQRAVDLYGRVLKALVTNFPDAQMQDGKPARRHWHTYGTFLREQRRWAEALDAFTHVPEQHPLHHDALYQRVVCQYRLMRQAGGSKCRQRAERVLEAAERALPALRRARQAARGKQAEDLLYQMGDTQLYKAEVLAEALDQPQRAMEVLDGFDQRFSAFPELVSAKRELRIGILVRKEEFEKAFNEVKAFFQQSPDKAGPLIRGVLDSVNRQLEARKAAGESRDKLGEISIKLARFFVEWAEGRDEFANDPAKMIAVRVELAEQFLKTGRHQEAMRLYEKLVAKPGGKNNLDVIYGLAQAAYRAEDYETALEQAGRIVRSVSPQEAAEQFWHAHAIRFRSMDRQHVQADTSKKQELRRQIFTGVKKLNLQYSSYFENNSGRWAEELNRLKVKHQP